MSNGPSRTRKSLIAIAAALVAVSSTAWAQWATQSITLQPGWNAVFLEVQPEPQDCDRLFANLPVESVWGWNRRFSPVQFVQDPTTLVPNQPDWLVYLPPTNQLAGTKSLFTLEGGKCYLIKRPNNVQPTTWLVQGRPSLRKVQWVANSFNFAGFALDKTNPPTFQAFFSGSQAHTNNPVYRLNPDGTWGKVTSLATTRMLSGEAFWIQCNGASDYQGPLSATLAHRTGLNYGRSLVEQSLTIHNSSTALKNIVITELSSGNPPNAGFPGLAGPVPLSFLRIDPINKVMGWFPIATPLVQSNLAPGQTLEMRLEIRRPDMVAYSRTASALYESLLEIRDLAGSSRVLIPVSAAGLRSTPAGTSSDIHPLDVGGPPLHLGLWIGSASVNMVNQPSALNPTVPTNTASAFQLRLIVHLDGTGHARLLQRALQMWKLGTYKPDPDNTNVQIVDQPGRFILLTDESMIQRIPGLTGAALRDDQPVGRRFSTAAFGFRNPVLMSGNGDFGVAPNLFACQIVLDYDDPLNPFKHRYHPDHDNLSSQFDLNPKLPEGQESFTVMRQVQFQFTDTDPDNLALAGWGDTQIGGIYRETITGLHKQSLYVQGTFRLQLASRVDVLNDGL